MTYVIKRSTAALLSAMLLIVGAIVFAPNANASEYAVIVNAENNYSASESEMRQNARRLFLSQQTNWPNGIEGAPFSRGEDEAQSAFNRVILGMDDVAYSDYWIRMKQSEGTVAPRAVGSTSILVRQISRHAGGFSVVSASEPLPDGVRVLFTFSQ
jgi:hypothetical protein